MSSQPVFIVNRTGPRVALVDPAPNAGKHIATAMQLFDSMLWAFQGLTQLPWTKSAPLNADVIVVPQGFPEEQLMSWNADRKLVVEIVTVPTEPIPDLGQYVLTYPFKARQALELLLRLETRLTTPTDVAVVGRGQPQGNSPDHQRGKWEFVEILRTLNPSLSQKDWFVGQRNGESLFWLSGDGLTYLTAPSTAQAIRSGTIDLSDVVLVPAHGSKPNPILRARASIELRWFAGYYASEQLAPWLLSAMQYNLTRWPDFGAIRPAPSQIRIAAVLSIEPISLSQLVERSKSSLPEATRTLNALATCGALAVVESQSVAKRSPRKTSATPRKGFTRFFLEIRKHLGLGV